MWKCSECGLTYTWEAIEGGITWHSKTKLCPLSQSPLSQKKPFLWLNTHAVMPEPLERPYCGRRPSETLLGQGCDWNLCYCCKYQSGDMPEPLAHFIHYPRKTGPGDTIRISCTCGLVPELSEKDY